MLTIEANKACHPHWQQRWNINRTQARMHESRASSLAHHRRANLVLEAVGNLPFHRVFGLVAKIQQQQAGQQS